MSKWIKKWKVQSFSGNGEYTVSIDKDGNYGCSCPAWIFRRQECHHIQSVKNGNGSPLLPKKRPEYRLAKVLKPIYDPKTNRLLVPLIGIPDAIMMEATICYYLFKHGYSLSEVRNLRGHLLPGWTKRAILAHVERHGEAEYQEGWYEH